MKKQMTSSTLKSVGSPLRKRSVSAKPATKMVLTVLVLTVGLLAPAFGQYAKIVCNYETKAHTREGMIIMFTIIL